MKLDNLFIEDNNKSLIYECEKCHTFNILKDEQLNIFKSLNEQIGFLNDGEQLTCESCDNIHTYNNPLISEDNENYDLNTPKCPVCNSANIDKISLANKAGSVAMFGVFSVGHVSKTFKCKNCGMKF